jgi:KipI family sensor histidine kinase inhibitor
VSDGRADRPRLRAAGDAALLVEFDAVIDVEVNARVRAVARAIAALPASGLRDVVPTYRSVAISFDPRVTTLPRVVEAVTATLSSGPEGNEGRLVEIPVLYGGPDGPDLDDVSAWAGLAPDEVVRRHTAATYRVFMMGFLPGFAYMGTVDAGIAAPRRATPRLRVPGGSVGIAGPQTGVYPRESPGGWQVIGRSLLPMFDAARVPPSLVEPGDRVRFTSVDRAAREKLGTDDAAEVSSIATAQTSRDVPAGLTVLAPGLFTTVQDLGRWGHQALGVPVAGAMDTSSHRIANQLVANPEDAATLEATVAGPVLRFDVRTTVAVAGADLGAVLDDVPMAPGQRVGTSAGSVLRFSGRRSGTRAYIACAGGIATEPVLGSRSTHVLCGLGGVAGRALKTGDRLPLGEGRPGSTGRRQDGTSPAPAGTVRPANAGARVRVLPGPQDDFFGAGAFEALVRARFIISPQSNRMGYRLSGASIPPSTREMISDATFPGAIQVPPSGEPILLMADRQTTGGYPQIATVITADMPIAAQLAPGDWIEFSLCTLDAATAALDERDRETDGRA